MSGYLAKLLQRARLDPPAPHLAPFVREWRSEDRDGIEELSPDREVSATDDGIRPAPGAAPADAGPAEGRTGGMAHGSGRGTPAGMETQASRRAGEAGRRPAETTLTAGVNVRQEEPRRHLDPAGAETVLVAPAVQRMNLDPTAGMATASEHRYGHRTRPSPLSNDLLPVIPSDSGPGRGLRAEGRRGEELPLEVEAGYTDRSSGEYGGRSSTARPNEPEAIGPAAEEAVSPRPDLVPGYSHDPAPPSESLPTPSLVIGRLSVEIVPTDPPHVPQPEQRRARQDGSQKPAGSIFNSAAKIRFGLGQM